MLSRFRQSHRELGHAVVCHGTLMETIHEAERKDVSLLFSRSSLL